MRLRQWLGSYGLLLAIAVFVLYTYHTGFTSPDPIDQIRQARSGVYSDWHPVVMALIWSVLDRVIPGPMGMLLFNSALFFMGLAWMGEYFFPTSARKRNAFYAMVVFFPTNLAMLGMVWKDVAMAAGLLFGLGAGLKLEIKRLREREPAQWVWLALSVFGLFYGSAVRLNAWPAVVPLVLGLALLVLRGVTKKDRVKVEWVSILSGGLIAIGLLIGNAILSRALIGPKSSYPLQQILIFDLGTMSSQKGMSLFPTYPNRPAPSLAEIRAVDNTIDAAAIVNSGKWSAVNDQEYALLRESWLAAVRSNPGLWLEVKNRRFSQFMSITVPLAETYSHNFWPDDRLGYPSVSSVQNFFLQRVVGKYLQIWQKLPVFALGGYLLFAMVFLGLLLRNWRAHLVCVSLLLSAIFYLLPYWAIGTALNFRYGWWAVLCVVMAGASKLLNLSLGAKK